MVVERDIWSDTSFHHVILSVENEELNISNFTEELFSIYSDNLIIITSVKGQTGDHYIIYEQEHNSESWDSLPL